MYVTRLMRDMQNFSFQRQRLVVLPTFDLLPRSAFFFCQEIVGGGIVGVLYYMHAWHVHASRVSSLYFFAFLSRKAVDYISAQQHGLLIFTSLPLCTWIILPSSHDREKKNTPGKGTTRAFYFRSAPTHPNAKLPTERHLFMYCTNATTTIYKKNVSSFSRSSPL